MDNTGGLNDDLDNVESPHTPGEDARCPKEVGHNDPSAASRGPTAPPEYIPATTKLPFRQRYTENLLSRPRSLSGDSKTITKTPAQGSTETLNAPSPREWRLLGTFAASPRFGQPLETVQPPPRIRGPPARIGIGYAPKRYGRPLEDGQPPPRIRHPPSRKRGLPLKLLGPLLRKGEDLLNASSPWPVPVQPVSSDIDLSAPDMDTGSSTADKGKAQQGTGSEDMANGFGDGVQLENSHKPSAQSDRTGSTSPAYPDPEQGRDDDKNEPAHPGAAHNRTRSPPSTKRVQLNQPMLFLNNTMRPEVTAVGRSRRGTHSETKANQSPAPLPETGQSGSSNNSCCCRIC